MPHIGDADDGVFFPSATPRKRANTDGPGAMAPCPRALQGALRTKELGKQSRMPPCFDSVGPLSPKCPPAQPTETPSQSQVVNFSLLNHAFGLQISASRRNYTIATYYSNCLYACNENLVLPSPPGGMGIACTVLGMHMHAMRRRHRLSKSFNRANQKGHGTL